MQFTVLVRLNEEGVIFADVKAKQQVSSSGLGSGPAPEFCAGPTSPLSRSLSIRARCAFYRREHGLRLLEDLSAPILNTTRTCWLSSAVSRCIKVLRAWLPTGETRPRQTVYVSKRHRLHGMGGLLLCHVAYRPLVTGGVAVPPACARTTCAFNTRIKRTTPHTP